MKVDLSWAPLVPCLIPAAGVVLLLLLDAVAPRLGRVHWLVTAAVLVVAAVSALPGVVVARGAARGSFCDPHGGPCSYAVDHVGIGLQVLILVFGAVVALLAYPMHAPRARIPVQATLVLAATAGSAGVVAARSMAAWLVLLELATLPTVALVALRGRRTAVEGALHLLTAALVSFALATMGAALWYAATGSGYFTGDAVVRAVADPDQRLLLLLAVAFLVSGLAFKLTLVPFHTWAPEAYTTASTVVGAFLAIVSKLAAVGALLVVMRGVTLLGDSALTGLGVLAALAMTAGNVLALRERTTLRFLAWSAIAQSGWILMPLATNSTSSVHAAAGYLVVYASATMLVFAVITALAHAHGRAEIRRLDSFCGLLRVRPLLGTALGLALLALAGLPPAVVGLMAKVITVRTVASDQTWWLAVIAAVNAMLGVAVYLRWLRRLVNARPDGVRPQWRERIHPLHLAIVGLGLAGMILTSVAPSLLLRFVGS